MYMCVSPLILEENISFDQANSTCICIWFMCSQCSHLYMYYHRWLVVNIWIRYKFKPWIKHIVHSSLHICCQFMFIVVHLLLQLYGIVYCEYLVAFLVKKGVLNMLNITVVYKYFIIYTFVKMCTCISACTSKIYMFSRNWNVVSYNHISF